MAIPEVDKLYVWFILCSYTTEKVSTTISREKLISVISEIQFKVFSKLTTVTLGL